MLCVLIIAGILVGLLIPAVRGAIRRTHEAVVLSEMQSFSVALASFKSEYGEYPPSRIVISEDGDYSARRLRTAGNGAEFLATRSMNYMRKFWPRIRVSTSGPTCSPADIAAGRFHDANGSFDPSKGQGGPNNGLDDPYILTGANCLVFFLGGVPQFNEGIGWSVTGFAHSSTFPFMSARAYERRDAPLYRFREYRLVNDTNNPLPPRGGFPGYIDALGSYSSEDNPPFYVMFSCYGESGYDPGDYDLKESDTTGQYDVVLGAFLSGNAPTSARYQSNPSIVMSPPPNPMTVSPPVPTLGDGHVDLNSTKPVIYHNQGTYQIICSGYDRKFGISGQLILKEGVSDPLPFLGGAYSVGLQSAKANQDVTGQQLSAGARQFEDDNLCNLLPGRLN